MSHGALLQSSARGLTWRLGSQQTLAIPVERSGIGLHSGLSTQVRLIPAEVGQGRYFVRMDLPEAPKIPARVESIRQTLLSTELACGEATVRTVEHLLAALAGMGIDNARIEIDGAEVPLLDGSALGWVEAIAQAGVLPQESDRPKFVLSEPIWVRQGSKNQGGTGQGDAFVAALPSPELRFTYGIDFDLPVIGNQWHSWSPEGESPDQGSSQESFAEAIAPARTFGLAHQIEQLQQQGLIRGGSLKNALVCGKEGWINPPLRFSNEPVRHKLLDLVGDLSLLGVFPQAHILAYKASHALHAQLTQHLAQVFQS